METSIRLPLRGKKDFIPGIFMKYQNEIQRRRTFAIISHPDAGKTTLTEKFLLFGGAIQVAGAVKNMQPLTLWKLKGKEVFRWLPR
jgi:hypothetical protein